jgi:hypothetical protein
VSRGVDDATNHDAIPTFFIDRSLGSNIVRTALDVAGANVVVHDEYFAPDEEDVVWLAEAGRRSWAVLTKDRRIRKRVLERRALKAAGVHAFFLGNGCRGGSAMATAYVSALPAMLRAIAKASAPTWMSVHGDGRLTLLPQNDDDEPEEDAEEQDPLPRI